MAIKLTSNQKLAGEEAGIMVVVGPPGAASVQRVTVLLSSVTAPLRAKTRPLVVAAVVSVMLESARILPAKLLPVPKVAELPTCQNTLQF